MGTAFKVGNLSFKYPSSREDTIKGISFDVREGEVFGFLGPSGAGKSTQAHPLHEFRKNGTLAGAVFPLDGIGFNEEFHSLLRSERIETIHTAESSMEDIFIKVTGVEVK